jgi:hypothetical protein
VLDDDVDVLQERDMAQDIAADGGVVALKEKARLVVRRSGLWSK